MLVNMNINNNVLSQPNSVLDLGLTVTRNFSPSIHIRNIVSKANSRAYSIHRSFVSRDVNFLIRAYTRSSATAKSTAHPSCLVGVLYHISPERIC